MQNYMLDMGFEQFNAQEDLLYTLAYSIARGLSKAGNAQLLCDFSAGTSHTGNEILSLSLALAKRIKQIAEMSPVLVGSGIGQQRTGHEIIFGSNHIGKMRVIR